MRCVINDGKQTTVEIKEQCSEKLQNPKIVQCAEKHKYTQYILKNIAIAVIGLGVFYGIACGMNKIATGRATFFHNQISDAQHQIKREISLIGMGA